jgi:hyperosmotically inducible periplasmic protein
MITHARSVMKQHTKAKWALAGLLVAIPVFMMAQDRAHVRGGPSDVQGAWHPGALPDNSAVNKQNHGDSVLSPENMGQSAADMDLTRRIRRAVLDDESLSTYAHNVKIIARDGKVTLRGPVRSTEEKMSVEQKAARLVGKENVKNEVEVSPEKGQ